MKEYRALLFALLIGANSFASNALAQDHASVELPGPAVFPESIAADAAGTLYGGSLASGGIWRIKPGEKKIPGMDQAGEFRQPLDFRRARR
jgi:hypothetical protein